MSDFKFLNAADIDRVLVDGTIKIGALSYYRELEGKQWIADRLEGKVNVKIDDLTVHSDEALAVTPEGYTPLVVGDGTGEAKISGGINFAYVHPDIFIFCASRGDLPELTKTMCDPQLAYDSCLRITDIRHLVHRLTYRAQIVELDKAPARGVFDAFAFGEVTYVNQDLDQRTLEARPPAPSPFQKHLVFAPQREVRIALVPRQPIKFSRLTVKIPRLGDLFVEEFRSV